MRVFIVAVTAAIVLAAGAHFALNAVQESSADAYATSAARLDSRNASTITVAKDSQPDKPFAYCTEVACPNAGEPRTGFLGSNSDGLAGAIANGHGCCDA